MDELISDRQAEWLVAIVAAMLLVTALGLWIGAREWMRRALGRRGALAALASGPLVYGLWRMDAYFIQILGFDTLKRVGVEAAIFLGLGIALGLWLRGDSREDRGAAVTAHAPSETSHPD